MSNKEFMNEECSMRKIITAVFVLPLCEVFHYLKRTPMLYALEIFSHETIY